ncbi:hypothetical protein [Corynebacterium aquatimens]|uniref:Secreted protein n=1 Tax=Corynebacterium aquatimens TaxID=1190508 RepID=A0A931E129_9CORY|nr:hypothetical protein [Corynebacterium aquatimens]MBG6122764.1 hypothetical protein [Corynebacterium aquatimens]
MKMVLNRAVLLGLGSAMMFATGLGLGAPVQAEDTVHSTHANNTSQRKTQGVDMCTGTDHERFMVTAPDGRKYDGWHPTVITRADGSTCAFGHEHGDNPEDSKIYAWTMEKLNQIAPNGQAVTGIPFGYVGHQSVEYAQQASTNPAHRHEDHYGHKVFVVNDVKLVNEDRTKGYVEDSKGKPVTCNYLIKLHQGTHSSDATNNNAHELFYAVQCSDGTEAVVSTLDTFGNPNEFTENCSGKTIKTSGSNLPAGAGGKRRIPTSDCLKKYKDVWAAYERWDSNGRIEGPTSGVPLAQYSPFFGVRNPSRTWDSTAKQAVPTAKLSNSSGAFAIPGYKVDEGTEQYALGSAFNGAKRDIYVAGTVLRNAGGPTTWYTNPYGGTPSTSNFVGAVPQYIGAVDNSSTQGAVERQAFGFSRNYGSAQDNVHAPN